MRLIGQLVNVANPAEPEVFLGYAVRITYLVIDPNQPERTFREHSESFDMPNDDNGFGFDIADRPDLNVDSPFLLSVINRERVEVFAKKYDWVEVLRDQRAQRILKVPVEGVEAPPVGTPVAVRGRIAIKGQPEKKTGFGGFSVRASYQARAAADGAFAPRASSATLGNENTFELALPVRERLRDEPVVVEAKYPDGQTGASAEFSLDRLREPVVLELDAPQMLILTSDGRAIAAQPEKLKGKVVDAQGTAQLRNRQVILWGKAGDGPLRAFLVAQTDNAGNFGGDRSKERFDAVVATVAGTRNSTLEHPVAVELVERDAANNNRGRLPAFVYLVVDLDASGGKQEEDCGCADGTAPRLPDQADLVGDSTYSQDIGPNCVNFTVPNRTLEEFTFTMVVRTSEPEIKGTTISDIDARDMRTRSIKELAGPPANYATAKTTISNALKPLDTIKADSLAKYAVSDIVKEKVGLAPYLSDMFKTVPGRSALSASNSVDWDGTPTFYQATTVAHGHILFYKQTWKADGYSLGDLLYSLPLAPGQKKQIVIFDWDRTEYGRRDEASHEDEALDSYLAHNRDILDITRGSVAEHMKGGSHNETSGSAGGIGGAAGGMFSGVFAGIAGGFSSSSGESSSSAWQDSSRDVAANGLNQLRDTIQQGASAVRNQRSTVVQTARQTERFRVETEVVANHNHCHAITVQYFEVLRHYAVEQKLVQVQECLFVPLLMSEFNEPKVARWMDLLRPALRDPNARSIFRLASGGISFRNKPLADGFEAIERRIHNYEGVDFPATTYAAEQVLDLSGDLTITLALNRPRDKDEPTNDDPIDPLVWADYGFFTGWTASFIFNNYFARRQQQERDRIFETEIAPRIAEGFVDTLQFIAIDKNGSAYKLDLDATLVSRYQRDAPLYVSIRPTAGALPVTREQIAKIVIATDYNLTASANSKILVRGATFRYRTAHFDGMLYRNDSVNNDLRSLTLPGITLPTDNVVLFTPLSTEELRNPKKEDAEIALKLLRHLNSNIEHYHKVIWTRMDPDRRYMLLDGFVAPNAGGKSVASVVENRVIGIAGNSFIMPVAPGYKLDPSYQYEPELDDNDEPRLDARGNIVYKPANLLEHYAPLTPAPPYRVSVPTRGVFAEAVMGACNSCEKKDETRFWRWEESPNPDEPTPINPIQTSPPQRSDPGDLKAAPFPTPMINIQNAPAAPEPGATLAGALGVLGKSDLFRDITGLEQTQKNALQAMLSNQESARHYADKAAELATLAANQRGGNSTVESIKKSMDDGTLDRDRGKKLIEDVYRAQISGKTSPDQPVNTANNSELAKAAADSVRQGREVSATQNHPDGTQTSVDQKTGSPSSTAAALKVALQKPDPAAPTKWVTLAPGEGPGFAKFDRAFDAAGKLAADFPNSDSGRFRILLVDSDPLAGASRDVKWQATLDAAGNTPFAALADTTITLNADLSQPGTFVSEPLALVHEAEDLPSGTASGAGASIPPGNRNYRVRRSGIFAKVVVEDAGQKHTFPTLAQKHKTLPIHVFLLKQGATLSIPHAEMADRIAEVQSIYEPHGVFLNAHPYTFSAAQTAKYKPAQIQVGTGVQYVASEIDVAGTFNQALMSDADLDKLAMEFPPNPGGPVIRIFFFQDFKVNNPVPAGSGARVALAMNRSFVEGKPLSDADKFKVRFSLMCAGRVQGAATLHPYAVAHEFGHLLMDKLFVLKRDGLPLPVDKDFHHHFNSPTAPAGFPLDQNLMRPAATNVKGIDQPKRLWEVKDKDGYNQLADLVSNLQSLQVP
jgi:hypothetical protein